MLILIKATHTHTHTTLSKAKQKHYWLADNSNNSNSQSSIQAKGSSGGGGGGGGGDDDSSKCKKCQNKILTPLYIIDEESKDTFPYYCLNCWGKIEKSFRNREMFWTEMMDGKTGYGKVEKMRWVEGKKAWLAYVNPRNGKKDEVIWQSQEKKQDPNPNGQDSFISGMESSDPEIQGSWICAFCFKKTNHPHEKDQAGKWTIKHNCQGKCQGYYNYGGGKEKCEKSNHVHWTQENINLLVDNTYGEAMCPDCRIKQIGKPANEKQRKILNKLTGNSGTEKTKSQMRCSSCNYKKDWTEADGIPLKCPKCGAEVGAGFDIHEVSINEKDGSRSWTPWIIGGGLVGIGIIGLIIWLTIRKKHE